MKLWPQSRGWRAALIGSGLLALGTGSLLGYWILDGRQRLRDELEALRASGAPEFREQLVFEPCAVGADANEWWLAVDEARSDLSTESLPECASRIAAGESLFEIEDELAAALSDPRRVQSLSDCELAILRHWVNGEEPALKLAQQVSDIGGLDWQARLRARETTFEELLDFPAIPGYLGSVQLLCRHALSLGVDGKFPEARRALALAHRAVELMGESPSLVTHSAEVVALQGWTSIGCLPLLHLMPAGSDWSDVDSLLASVDLSAAFEHACIGERTFGNGIYRVMRETGGMEELGLPPHWPRALVLRTFFDRDQATYLLMSRRAIDTARERENAEPWKVLGREFEARIEGFRNPIDGVLWRMILPNYSETAQWSLRIQTHVRLVRAAIRARREGADAAIAWLAQYRDPFDGQALRSRLDPDGVLSLWSVGKDGRDDPPQAEGGQDEQQDDILVQVRVP